MVSLDPDGKTAQEGMSICTKTGSKMIPVEYLVQFWRTNTKNRSINIATTTTIWMKVKDGEAQRQSLTNKSEVYRNYYTLPK